MLWVTATAMVVLPITAEVDAAHPAQERGTAGGAYRSVACEREASIAASLGGAVGVVGPSGS